MAKRDVKIKPEQWDIQSELIFEVDDEKFTETLADEIHSFLGGSESRVEDSGGSVIDAALRLYACECFRLVAFNNFMDEYYVTEKFNLSSGHGVEGFSSFEEARLKRKEIEYWHIEFDHVEISK
jgi:hypothetical protein